MLSIREDVCHLHLTTISRAYIAFWDGDMFFRVHLDGRY
jgi:hypothetical protein